MIGASQFILSLRAVEDPATKGRYTMQMKLNRMVGISNPNDVTFEYAPGPQLGLQLPRIPYRLTWDIRRGMAVHNSTAPQAPGNLV